MCLFEQELPEPGGETNRRRRRPTELFWLLGRLQRRHSNRRERRQRCLCFCTKRHWVGTTREAGPKRLQPGRYFGRVVAINGQTAIVGGGENPTPLPPEESASIGAVYVLFAAVDLDPTGEANGERPHCWRCL